MTYRIKITRMIDGKRVELWLREMDDLTGYDEGSRYDRSYALHKVQSIFEAERRNDNGLVAVELVEVT